MIKLLIRTRAKFSINWWWLSSFSTQIKGSGFSIFFSPGLGLNKEKAMVTHSSTHAWKIPWAEEPGRLQSMGSLRVGHDWVSSFSRIGEGNGNPHHCSCLENPRDGEPRGLPSMGSHRVGHDWSNLAAAAATGLNMTRKLVSSLCLQAWF